MSNVPTNLIPSTITQLPEYTGNSTLGYFPYSLNGRTYKVQFTNLAAVGAVPSTRVIATGNGLQGGGDLSQNRTISIIPNGIGYSQLDFTGVVAGTYGSASSVATVTVDATGRVTSASSTPIVLSNYVPSSRTVTAGAGLTGGGQLNGNITISLNPSNATPQSLGVASAGTGTQAARDDHVHPAVNLTNTSETQGVLPLGRGGTGVNLSPVLGAVIYAGSGSLNQTTAGNAGQVLTSAGGVGAPYWQTVTGTGTVTSIDVSGGTTGLTTSGGPITTLGTITLGGTLNVANGGTGATNAATARSNLSAAKSGANTDITSVALTTGTISTTPTANTDIANKLYVDNLYAAGIHYHQAVKYEVPNTTGNLNATYNNGTAGVGATLTNAGTLGAFTPDGVVASIGDRVLIYNQSNAAQNGVYTVTVIGDGSTPWVLTRSSDTDNYSPTSPNGLGQGDAFYVTSGNTGAGETYVCTTSGTITFGTTAISFAQISAVQVYSAGTGLTLTNTTFSLTSPVAVSLGGTGATSLTSGYLVKGNGTSAVSASVVYDNGTNVGIGTASPANYSGYTTLDIDNATNGGLLSIKKAGTTVGYINGLSGMLLLANSTDLKLTATGANTVQFTTNGSERMRIDSSGNVGIGTTTPSSLGLLVASKNTTGFTTVAVANSTAASANDGAKFSSFYGGTELSSIGHYWDGSGFYGRLYSYGVLTFVSGSTPTERMRLTDSGNLGIGTTSPNAKLEVAASTSGGKGGEIIIANSFARTAGNYSQLSFKPNSDYTGTVVGAFIRGLATSADPSNPCDLVFGAGSGGAPSERMRIDSSGRVGIGVTPSAWTVTALQMAGSSAIGFNNQYGEIDTNAYYNAGYKYIGTGLAAKYGQEAGVHKWFTAPSGTAGNAVTFTQTMTLDASGNLGIGTTSPGGSATDRQVTIQGTTAQLSLGNGSFVTNLGTSASLGYVQVTGANPLTFITNGSERMRITSAGDVGIGTSSPAQKLDVAGLIQATSNFPDIRLLTSSGYGWRMAAGSTGTTLDKLYFQSTSNSFASANTTMVFDSNNVGIGTASPAVKLDIAGAATTQLRIQMSGQADVRLISDTGTGITGTYSNHPFSVKTNSATVATFDTAGNLGIGTTSPTEKLVLNSGSAVQVATKYINTNTTGVSVGAAADGSAFVYQAAALPFIVYTNAAERFRITSTGGITSSDLADAVGYKGLPQNAQTASYTLALSDMGKHISITTGGVVIPANASVAFPVGAAVSVYNNSASNQTISITTDTLRQAGTANTGSRTLAQYGVATLVKVAATVWIISGAGVS